MEEGASLPNPPQLRQLPEPEPDRLDLAKASRLRLALTGDAEDLFALIRDPDPELLRTLLKNPILSEEHLLSLLKRRDLGEQLIRSIDRLPQVARSRQLKIALAAHPRTPASVLSSLLPQLFLFELVSLLQRPGVGPDLKLAAERAILKRLPETEVGNKITLARRGSPAILEALLKLGEPSLLDAALANPRLKESSLVSLLNSPATSAETISTIARHARWGRRANLRFAMLRNRNTPAVWFTLFLPSVGSVDLQSLLSARGLNDRQLAEVRSEIARRLSGSPSH